MKKYMSLNLILFTAFLTGTILTIFIIYKDIDTSLSLKFIIGYVIYLLLYGLFFIFLVIANTRKLNCIQIRKRFFTFIIWFISLSALHYLLSYFFRRSEMDVWDLGTPLGVSIGLAFSDLMYWKKKVNEK
ncbi:hypothetical protein MHH33_13170 [Paenisporosarcina sp. FSL H8-0542]|uniref:hypothetical protein n=1 Tax=unclassified Paenisporosarcina TaxID=2642018 RepID=UPI00034EB3E6|nr:hypothetical protein [Paenisporosarcina sp. HGH0030]EPD52101.1 hypothetical protein HMPREF1210_01454 [Paenisporosarcina sp. HGH0030]